MSWINDGPRITPVQQWRELKQERDELLEALKICKAAMDADSDAVENVYEIVTETLARVEHS